MSTKNRLLYKPPPTEDYSRNFCKLYIVIAISFVFISAEFVGGYISGSISVISDAFHLVTDLIGFSVSFGFIYLSRKTPTEKMTFGFHRMELLGALGNLFIIWFLAIFMIYEATIRIIDKEFVKEPLAMLIVGVGGLAVNIIMFFVLHSGSHSHGLMSEACDHHPEPHDNDPTQNNCTTSFCNELVCEDVVCIKQVNSSHCHTKDKKGDTKIHIHDENRKLSDELDGKNDEVGETTINKLDDSTNKIRNQKHQYEQEREHQHEHQHEHKHDHDHSHSHKQQKEKKHVHGQNCKHGHSQSGQIQLKNRQNSLTSNNKQPKHEHVHGQNCSHKQAKNHKHQHKVEEHKHGEGCKHGHDHKQKGHSHDHGHQHNHGDHDHEHGHDHDHSQEHQSISMKAAVLHAFSDVIQSIGLLISSLFIFFLGSNKGSQVYQWNNWHYFDPISTYVFSILVVCSTIPIVKNCYYIIMEATPSTKIARQIKREFQQAPGVIDVHDLHIWSLRPGKNLLIAHVFAKDGAQREVLTSLTQICRRRKIFHSTLQVEEENWKNHEQYILCDHDIH